MSARRPVELTDVEWVTVRGIKRARPIQRAPQPTIEPASALADLIACPTCHAKITEVCRTPSGHSTDEHDTRIVSRRCGCGDPIPPRCKYCPTCRAKRDQASKNEHNRLLRAARRAA